MKISLNWIKEFVNVDMTADELVQKIGAQLGAVEEVIDLSKKYQRIVIAKVVTCDKHPNADKLKVCTIDDGGNTPDVKRNEQGHVEVVCGAPNVTSGMLVAWLPPGATVPATYDKDPLVLEARDIRGVVSNGMLASAHELAISDDHSGIVELGFGEIGGDFAKEFGLDDCIIDIENKMFTHRPDCFGILGVAREIAGITGQQFNSPDWYKKPTTPQNEGFQGPTLETGGLLVGVKNGVPVLVPRFMVQVIEGVDVKPSPLWMQSYLCRAGIRPINNIVDVTNYVMYLTAQPLHAYDYDKLCKVAGTNTAQLETRMSKKGDKLKLLNGKTVTFEDSETILITSNDVPVGIGGVMGGADTEVDESTKNIVLECANFDMYSIRRASMRHGLFTDAVTRFNKGQSPLQIPAILQKSIGWATQLAGGKAGKSIDTQYEPQEPVAVKVTEQFINERLGLNLSNEVIAKLLANVEFEVATQEAALSVLPPFWRTDIEIPEDVVEEIGRLYGYDHLPLELPKRDLTPVPKNGRLDLKDKVRAILSAAGASELLTYSFVHGDLLGKVGQDKEKAFQVANALSPDLQYYRMSLLPSLLEKVHPNIKAGHDEFVLYELGKAHIKEEIDAENVPVEDERLGLVFAVDDKVARANYSGAPFYHARKYADNLFNSLGVHVEYMPATHHDPQKAWGEQILQPFQRSRTAYIKHKDIGLIGFVGELTPTARQRLKLPAFTAALELDLLQLQQVIGSTSTYTLLPRFPGVSQDISLKVPADLAYGELHEFIEHTIEQLKVAETRAILSPVDAYQGEDTSLKHMTFRLTIASYERTLTDQEVNKLLDDVAAAAHTKFGAERL
jgi:phenylalanyl-tRNA synthetase beta chain